MHNTWTDDRGNSQSHDQEEPHLPTRDTPTDSFIGRFRALSVGVGASNRRSGDYQACPASQCGHLTVVDTGAMNA